MRLKSLELTRGKIFSKAPSLLGCNIIENTGCITVMDHEDFFLYGKIPGLVNPERKWVMNEFGKIIETRRRK